MHRWVHGSWPWRARFAYHPEFVLASPASAFQTFIAATAMRKDLLSDRAFRKASVF